MPRISSSKEAKIKEAILHLLFSQSPKSLFTYHIAQELARDEEYVKKLMEMLETKGLVTSVKKNSKGIDYSRRIRWRLSTKAYDAYKNINGNTGMTNLASEEMAMEQQEQKL